VKAQCKKEKGLNQVVSSFDMEFLVADDIAFFRLAKGKRQVILGISMPNTKGVLI
jgi:hypothetical protein